LEANGIVGGAVLAQATRSSVRPSLLAVDAEMDHGQVRFGSAAIKDVAGLDAKQLLVGSGGSAGTLLRATFRVTPS